MRVTKASGEKVGYEARASTSPVLGSIATPAAPLAPVAPTARAMAASSASWVFESIDRRRSRPGVGLCEEM